MRWHVINTTKARCLLFHTSLFLIFYFSWFTILLACLDYYAYSTREKVGSGFTCFFIVTRNSILKNRGFICLKNVCVCKTVCRIEHWKGRIDFDLFFFSLFERFDQILFDTIYESGNLTFIGLVCSKKYFYSKCIQIVCTYLCMYVWS